MRSHILLTSYKTDGNVFLVKKATKLCWFNFEQFRKDLSKCMASKAMRRCVQYQRGDGVKLISYTQKFGWCIKQDDIRSQLSGKNDTFGRGHNLPTINVLIIMSVLLIKQRSVVKQNRESLYFAEFFITFLNFFLSRPRY